MPLSNRLKFGIKLVVALVILAGAGLVFAKYYPFQIAPCSQPIKYTLGQFDTQFNLSQSDFLAAVAEAEKVWEGPSGKNLFEYSPNDAVLKVNLIYDSRQQATDQLKSLGYTIENTQSSYNSLKARYDSLLASYNTQKAALDTETNQFNADRASYEAEVTYWNGQGGAPKAEAQKLNQEYSQLNQRATDINNKKDTVNALVSQINPLVDVLNNLASQLKLNVNNYNNIGTARGEEFEEGEYVEDNTGRHIDIYEFTSHDQLVRLLAHELGHSLGLQHVDDPNAIMYRLNQSQNNQADAADLQELDQVCHLKV